MTIRGEIRSEHVPQHVDALAAAGVCTDSFIAWKNSLGACQSFIAADQLLIESVGNPRCARMPAESVVGVYRVYVDLALNSRRPDFVNRMISTIPLGVLVGLASIPTVLPGDYAHADQFVAISRVRPFLLPSAASASASDCIRLHPTHPTHPTSTLTPIEVKRSTR